ncbi:MAG: ATP-binding protein [Muribaculaceae bacterium]|nr:ATP-binding protein [Muribaculaceae bacterium]
MSTPRYPIGDSSFRYIREHGFFYIDKTEAVYRLAHQSKYCFLSRPRRFGKSLLVSTLEAYFRGQRYLFDGLAMSGLEKEWTEYPVLRLDLSAGDMTCPDNLKALLNNRISYMEDDYGRRNTETTFAERFSGVIRRAYEQSGHGVVVLIDEYDNPMISTLGNPEVHEQMRTTLKGIYTVLKAESEHIRFCFLTGITRFSKMSVFSGLNNLQDLTLNPRYADICGITQYELETYCSEGIETVAEINGVSYEEALGKLKAFYDGYHFAYRSPDIYNPFSLLQALQTGELYPYWNESGGRAEFLWKAVSRHADRDILGDILTPLMRVEQLGAPQEGEMGLHTLLFQTGYLTIKSYEADEEVYRLGVPNREVMNGIMYGLLPYVADSGDSNLTTDLYSLRKSANAGDADAMLRCLRSFLAGVSNRLTRKMPEIYYENNLYILFTLTGLKTSVEVDTSDGRMDVLMECRRHIYIIELKLDRSAEEALEQIRRKHYALSLERRGLPVTLIGINFSTKTRNIESWKWERINV